MPARLLALFPASFFLLAALVNLRDGTLYNLVWVCNVMNVALAASLALAWARGIWIATLWILIGSPLWFLDASLTGVFDAHSFLTHVVAAGLGVWALFRTPHPRHLWWQALLVGFALQVITRQITPPEINVTIAFAAYAPIGRALPFLTGSFAVAWAANIGAFAVMLFCLDTALARITKS